MAATSTEDDCLCCGADGAQVVNLTSGRRVTLCLLCYSAGCDGVVECQR